MRTFNAPGPAEFARLNTQEIRRGFLLDRLFEPGQIHLVATGLDRMIVGGVMPATEIALEAVPELRARYFNERRETGVLNIGGPGRIVVDGTEFEIGTRECLYIGKGARDIRFQAGEGAVYYLVSCPAHRGFQQGSSGMKMRRSFRLAIVAMRPDGGSCDIFTSTAFRAASW